MSEYHSYTHRSSTGATQIRTNYTWSFDVENAWLEEEFQDFLDAMKGKHVDDAEGSRSSVEYQHLIALLLEEIDREELIEKAHSMDAEELSEEYIKPIEERRYLAEQDPREKLSEQLEDMDEDEIADLVEEIEGGDD